MLNMVHSKATVYSEERSAREKNTHIYTRELKCLDASYKYGEGYNSNYSVHKIFNNLFTLLL